METWHSDDEYLTPALARSRGVGRREFYKHVEEEGYERVGRGVYAPCDEIINDELLVLSIRCSQAVFSHDEALYHHRLVDRESFQHTFTIYSGYNVHRLREGGRNKAFFVQKELLDVGRITVRDTLGHDVPMYDMERTICDLVRSRSWFEIQDYTTALKTYAMRRDKDINRLMRYARLFHVDKIIRGYLELLL